MSNTLRVQVNTDDCMSSGKCVYDAPHAFAFDENELAVVQSGAADLDDAALQALVRNCPSGALQLLDRDGNLVDS